ncbi:hypothetical protein EC845_0001, partial [Comamonas sp. BIGb0124]
MKKSTRRSLMGACALASILALQPLTAQAQKMVLKAADVHPAGY